MTPLGYPARLLGPGETYASVTDTIGSIALGPKASPRLVVRVCDCLHPADGSPLRRYIFAGQGVGIWGINIPVAWGFAIVNFVWWIGIGHAGTFISAILLLLLQKWRTSINRLTEAMTLFAVACAGIFPLLHLGRPWIFYWLFPYPDTMGLWPQFRSPLVWDVFAVSTYFTVSLIFWYIGLIPDLATLRDKRYNQGTPGNLRNAGSWLARAPPCTGNVTNRPICSWLGWRRRWSSRFIASSALISPSPSCLDGIPPSFRPTSSRARFIPGLPWF